ncbi:MAG TPA: hypothetical protein VFC19_08035 [Candidatus Limnocylindrales bacterium]|nr:hypothetical protein [Candidatus Limnocylindrales bacterium]
MTRPSSARRCEEAEDEEGGLLGCDDERNRHRIRGQLGCQQGIAIRRTPLPREETVDAASNRRKLDMDRGLAVAWPSQNIAYNHFRPLVEVFMSDHDLHQHVIDIVRRVLPIESVDPEGPWSSSSHTFCGWHTAS